MRHLYTLPIVGLLVLVIIVAAYTVTDTPHNFTEAECRDCHIDHGKDPARLAGPVTELCRDCHKRTIRANSHPVDMSPQTAKIPADLPLTDGKVTCNTCHNIHGEARQIFGYRSYFLRRPASDLRFFCVSCHEENRARPGHKELVTLAHMGSQYIVTDPDQPLDPLSIECIGCHDGSLGGDAQFELGEGIWSHPMTIAHPIGVHYNTARMRTAGLRPPTTLDRKLRFYAGRMGCGTCHDMYSTLEARLVMDNTESRLCTACHYDK